MILLASTLAMMITAASVQAMGGDIEAAGPNGPLKGTLTGDGKPDAPVVLVIPGSGPTDRDGNSPLGVKANTYRLLADGLAQRGVAAVRIDKRGMFASAAATPDANAVTIEDYARDTHAWVDAIRRRTGARCVWLLGHSEGGLVALAAAQRGEHVCGLVLVATAGRPLGEVLKAQLRANPANAALIGPADAAIDALAAKRRVDVATLPPPLAPLFNPAVQGFLISAFALDPAKLAAGVRKPVLVIQGGRDLQVGVEDARLLAAAPGARLVVLPEVNHVLKAVGSDDRGANVATYADPELPLGQGVVEAIVGFVWLR